MQEWMDLTEYNGADTKNLKISCIYLFAVKSLLINIFHFQVTLWSMLTFFFHFASVITFTSEWNLLLKWFLDLHFLVNFLFHSTLLQSSDGGPAAESLLSGHSSVGLLWLLPLQQTAGHQRPERDPLRTSRAHREFNLTSHVSESYMNQTVHFASTFLDVGFVSCFTSM